MPYGQRICFWHSSRGSMASLQIQTDAGMKAAFASLGRPSAVAESFARVASPVVQQYETTKQLNVSKSDLTGLGDQARLVDPGTAPSVYVLVGDTLLQLDFIEGPVGGEKWLVPLAQQALTSLSATTITTDAH